MNHVRMKLTERDLENLTTVIEWGLSDYDDKEHIGELTELLVRVEDSLERLRRNKED